MNKNYIAVKHSQTGERGAADLKDGWIITFKDRVLLHEFLSSCQRHESISERLDLPRYVPANETEPLTKAWLALDSAESLLLDNALAAQAMKG